MANETIGRVKCPRHGNKTVWGEVSKNKNGRLYYRCGDPGQKWRDGCGLVDDAGANFQEWMLTHAEIYGVAGPPLRGSDEPTPAATPDPAVEPQPEVTPMADEKKVVKTKTVTVPKDKGKAKKKDDEAAPARKPADENGSDDKDDDWLL